MKIATWIREVDDKWFPPLFASYEGVELCDARVAPVSTEACQSLLLTGGSDISAPFLRQENIDESLIKNPDPARDEWEFSALQDALALGLPILGICRGLQVLNVGLGGSLLLDIPGHDDAKSENIQPMIYEPGAAYQFPCVNSSHHQAIDQIASNLIIEGRSANDGIIEQVRIRDYPFGFAVQYHPERDPLYLPIFDDFVRACR